MFPEQLSMHLIRVVADDIDAKRIGDAIEIGVGTTNFYSIVYKALAFRTIAVDPIPYQPFLTLANQQQIIYDESCIYIENGEQVIYINDHSDFNSLHNNWLGNDKTSSKTVKSQDLKTFIEKHRIKKISFLKVDTEGSEYEILQQFKGVDGSLLPEVIEFEYGGGGLKSEQKGGWRPDFFGKSLKILEVLKSLKYKEAVILDSIDLEPTFFSFENTDDFDELFKPGFEYGNLIAFKESIKDKRHLKEHLLNTQNTLLADYIDDLKKENVKLIIALVKKDLKKRISLKLKKIFKIK